MIQFALWIASAIFLALIGWFALCVGLRIIVEVVSFFTRIGIDKAKRHP